MKIQKLKATAFMTPCHQNTKLKTKKMYLELNEQRKGQEPQRKWKYRWKIGKDSAWKLGTGTLVGAGRFVHCSQQCRVW